MRGWIVLYSFGHGDLLPRHYKTLKQAQRFADEHRRLPRCEALIVDVEDLVIWVNSGLSELERMFKLEAK